MRGSGLGYLDHRSVRAVIYSARRGRDLKRMLFCRNKKPQSRQNEDNIMGVWPGSLHLMEDMSAFETKNLSLMDPRPIA